MKLKRIQIVQLVGGQSKLMLDGHGPYGLSDLTNERGIDIFRRLLLKRLQSPSFYRLNKTMDMMAMACCAFAYAETHAEGGHLQYNLNWSRSKLDSVFEALCEGHDTQDPALTFQGEFMGRYRRLFVHLYGEQLAAKGINLDD